ncbi:MAG: hypothetical protein EOS27_24365 [Mesorhizobium sp.]|nr:MAG: hypothetical protein EOS27_24365 [Mesorhizobium sp.]
MPAFKVPETDSKDFAKLETVHRNGKKGGTPGSMLSEECGSSIGYVDEGLRDEYSLTIGFYGQPRAVRARGACLLVDEIAMGRISRRFAAHAQV